MQGAASVWRFAIMYTGALCALALVRHLAGFGLDTLLNLGTFCLCISWFASRLASEQESREIPVPARQRVWLSVLFVDGLVQFVFAASLHFTRGPVPGYALVFTALYAIAFNGFVSYCALRYAKHLSLAPRSAG